MIHNSPVRCIAGGDQNQSKSLLWPPPTPRTKWQQHSKSIFMALSKDAHSRIRSISAEQRSSQTPKAIISNESWWPFFMSRELYDFNDPLRMLLRTTSQSPLSPHSNEPTGDLPPKRLPSIAAKCFASKENHSILCLPRLRS